MLGAHALRVPGAAAADSAAQQASILQGVFSCPAEELHAAAFPSHGRWSLSGGVLVSHIPSMNTACKEDPSLSSVPVPAVSERNNIRVTVQDRAGTESKLGPHKSAVNPPALEKPCESPAHLARRRSEDTASEPDVEQSSVGSASCSSAEIHAGCASAEAAEDCDWDVASSDGYWNALADQMVGHEDESDDEDIVMPAAVAPVLSMDRLPALPTAATAQAAAASRRGTKRGRPSQPVAAATGTPQSLSFPFKRQAVAAFSELATQGACPYKKRAPQLRA